MNLENDQHAPETVSGKTRDALRAAHLSYMQDLTMDAILDRLALDLRQLRVRIVDRRDDAGAGLHAAGNALRDRRRTMEAALLVEADLQVRLQART